mmetsp:Transcript_40294/g.79588  ORF Transcript_40294/g.79588 Transcript_40294/m.79588 type:complete len:380 (+) Transcript_40294:330-1469(+)
MLDWMVHCRPLMASAEYGLVWLSFASVLWLSIRSPFGVIQGMVLGTVFATSYFAVKYAVAQRNWEVLNNAHSSVTCRPLRERVALDDLSHRIFAVSMRGFSFFGSSLVLSQTLVAEAHRLNPIWVCIDFRGLVGIDSTAAGQLKFLVLQLRNSGMHVSLSSVPSKNIEGLLQAHQIIGPQGLVPDDLIFSTLDDALQGSENKMLVDRGIDPQMLETEKRVTLEDIFQNYIDSMPSSELADARSSLARHFVLQEVVEGEWLFEARDKPKKIYIVGHGTMRLVFDVPVSKRDVIDESSSLADEPKQLASFIGDVLGDAAFYGRDAYGFGAKAEEGGCTVYSLSTSKIQRLEHEDLPSMYLLHKIFIYNNARYQKQYLVPKG